MIQLVILAAIMEGNVSAGVREANNVTGIMHRIHFFRALYGGHSDCKQAFV